MTNVLEPIVTEYHMYYLDGCPYSMKAEELLKSKGLDYSKHTDLNMYQLKEKYGKTATFPRIYNKNNLIGGYDDLKKLMN